MEAFRVVFKMLPSLGSTPLDRLSPLPLLTFLLGLILDTHGTTNLQTEWVNGLTQPAVPDLAFVHQSDIIFHLR